MKTSTKASVATLVLASLAAIGCQSQGKTQGQKDTEKLTATIDKFADTLEKSKADLQTTLAAHDAVVSGQGDLPKFYGDFTKGLDKCKKNEAAVAKYIADVKAAAEVRFAEWQKTIEGIGSEDLKSRSQKDMEATRKRYEEVVALGEKAKAAYSPLMTKLDDHATYWASNLNPTSAQSLASDNDAVQKNATTIYGVLDQVVAAANSYTEASAMKAAPPTATEASEKAE